MMTWELRQSYAVLLERQASDAAVTFVWNDSSTASVEKIKKDLRCIHARVDRQLLGRRFHFRQPNQLSQVWAVIEKLDSYPHVHCGWKMPEQYGLKDLEKLFSEGLLSNFSQPIGYDIRKYEAGWGGYATKSLTDSRYILDGAEFLR